MSTTRSLRVLVTGGAGFIGSHVTDALIAAGHEVAIVDNLSSGRRELVDPRAGLYELELTSPDLRRVIEEFRPDVVDHHAAQIDVRRSVQDPVEDARVNVLGSLNLLEACVVTGVERFIFASSGGAMYGEPRALPCPEDHPVEPLSPYGAAKAAVETYLHYYRQVHGLKAFALRYANVYGPRQDPYGEAGVVAIFTQAFLQGRAPTVFGDGDQERDFVYVGDVVRANLDCLTADCPGAYNVGTGRGTSVNEIVTALRELTTAGVTPEYAPARAGEVYRICLDTNRARDVLGWTAQVSLPEGLRRTVEYFSE